MEKTRVKSYIKLSGKDGELLWKRVWQHKVNKAFHTINDAIIDLLLKGLDEAEKEK